MESFDKETNTRIVRYVPPQDGQPLYGLFQYHHATHSWTPYIQTQRNLSIDTATNMWKDLTDALCHPVYNCQSPTWIEKTNNALPVHLRNSYPQVTKQSLVLGSRQFDIDPDFRFGLMSSDGQKTWLRLWRVIPKKYRFFWTRYGVVPPPSITHTNLHGCLYLVNKYLQAFQKPTFLYNEHCKGELSTHSGRLPIARTASLSIDMARFESYTTGRSLRIIHQCLC